MLVVSSRRWSGSGSRGARSSSTPAGHIMAGVMMIRGGREEEEGGRDRDAAAQGCRLERCLVAQGRRLKKRHFSQNFLKTL